MQGLGREVQIRRRRSLCCQCMGPDGRADGKKQGHERYARLILQRNVQVAVQQKIRLSLKPARPKVHKEKGDRKSVVSGKSVSVRVDLGGRRIIKKKKNKQ